MRKNHHGKKDRLVKRVFALCLALAVICTCLVPVFATEGLSDPQVNQEASRPVDDGEASYPDDEFAGFGEEEATRPVDGGEAAGFGEDEVATRPVEGGEDNLDGGPTVKETEWGTVIEYGPSSSTSTDPSSSTETQWSGEDDVVEKPDDKVVVSGDEIKKLQDMVVYRFWLKELNANDLQDITAQAQINNMTESEYLARNGEVLWNLYFIQAVPRAETIADYSSYINTPSSNRDPKGELRQFDYWYTLDEFGNRVRLNLTDPTSNILDDKTTTVNVYAAWKDGTVGSDEEEDVDHEDLVDKNPVPVDLEAPASVSYEDEEGNEKTASLPVEVKNLPSAADHLSVNHMGDTSMQEFYEKHEDSLGEMMPILGLKISPKNAKGEKVQPAKGEKATVTVSGLNKLPEIAAMEEEGALTADALKVLHQKDDNTVEKLDVVSYENGTLTFETTSFSPFVIALAGGYDVETLEAGTYNKQIGLHSIEQIIGNLGQNDSSTNNHKWTSSNGSVVSVSKQTESEGGRSYVVGRIEGLKAGKTATITHTYRGQSEKFVITVLPEGEYPLYVYTLVPGKKINSDENSDNKWNSMQIGTIKYNAPATNLAAGTAVYAGNATIQSLIGNTITIDPKRFPMIEGYRIATNAEQKNQQGYYTVDWVRVVVSGGANAGNNASDGIINPVVQSRYYTFHLDGVLSPNETDYNTVSFAVKEPGQGDFVINQDFINRVPTGTYMSNNTLVRIPSEKEYPQQRPGSDGQLYKFDGWYRTDACNPEDKVVSWSSECITSNRIYYARYIPASVDLKISKTVTGLLGDTQKEFTFKVTGDDLKANTKILGADGTELNHGSPKFVMKHGDTATVTNVPYNAVFCVYEDKEGATAYETSATGQTITQSGENNRKFYYKVILVNGNPMLQPCKEDGTAIGNPLDTLEIVVTNHCTLKPDTGVLLDTLPYIVILAVVAGGVALLMLRKRRKEDD